MLFGLPNDVSNKFRWWRFKYPFREKYNNAIWTRQIYRLPIYLYIWRKYHIKKVSKIYTVIRLHTSESVQLPIHYMFMIELLSSYSRKLKTHCLKFLTVQSGGVSKVLFWSNCSFKIVVWCVWSPCHKIPGHLGEISYPITQIVTNVRIFCKF